jgi:predicted transposase YdaD
MYFFRRAEGSTVEELLDRLPDPVFKRAVGVLEMISRTPDQRRHYDARLKWELDENTRIQTAFEEGEIKGREEGEIKGREEGELKGREEGELFGKIRMLQNLLSLPQSTDDALHPRSRTELETLVTELQAQLRKRMM